MKTRTLKIPAVLFRTGTMSALESGETNLSISSDVPYLRYDWQNDENYYEVLDHSPEGMDSTRLRAGAAMLFNHNRDIQLGTLSAPEMKDGKCYVKAKVSAAPDVASYKIRMEEGILKDSSVGYTITDDGTCIGAKDGTPIYKFKWAPHEASMVTIPADITVGLGKDHNPNWSAQPGKEVEMREIFVKFEKEFDILHKKTHNQPTLKKLMAEPIDPPVLAKQINIVEETSRAVIADRKRRERIENHAKAVKERTKKEAPEVLAKFLFGEKAVPPTASELDIERNFNEFQQEYAEASFKMTPIQNVNPELGLSRNERKHFSIVKLMREIATDGYEGVTGLEKEACEQAAKLYRRDSRTHSGFTLPEDITNCRMAEDHQMSSAEISRQLDDIRRIQASSMAQGRALNATNFGAGGALVGVELLTGSIIDLLRNKVIMTGLGITEIGGLVGDVAIPRVTGGATVYWLAEGAAVTESDQTFQQIYFSPHRMGADTAYTKQLLSQASLSVEAFVRNDIAQQMAVEEDRVGFNGAGVNGEPLGIFNTSGVGAGVTFGGNATWKTVSKFEYDIENANADLGPMSLVTTPTSKYYLKITPKIAASTFPIYLWDNDPAGPMINGQRGGLVNGYPAFSTKNVPNNLVVQGVWSEFVKCRWAGIDVVVDPYSLKKQEQIEITVHQWMDQGVRHPVAFDTSTDAPTSP